MKVYRLEFIESGEYEILTEKELQEEYTPQKIENFKSNNMVIFYETKFTTRQLTQAKKWKRNNDWCWDFEQEHGIAPSLFDILEVKYN